MSVIISVYGEEKAFQFEKKTYVNNGNLAIQIYSYDEEYEFWEPWCSLTVNLDAKVSENQAYIDVNNCSPEIVNWMYENKYMKAIGSRPSGFCLYPLVEFSKSFMETILVEGDE